MRCSLFKPINITGVGMVQDGALAHNNPASLAEWESRQIWPHNKKPDVLLSLGTGTSAKCVLQNGSRFHHFITNGFVPRLWRSFMSSMDGQRAWVDLLNRLDDEHRKDYFRLNVCLSGDDCAIDDTSSIDDLRSSVRLQTNSRQDCVEIAIALLVSSFFFELHAVPTFSGGRYHCEGWIRCRLHSDVMFNALLNVHQAVWTFITDTEVLGQYTPKLDSCSTCSSYRKSVRFCVRHPSDLINIYMRDPNRKQRRISGFPESIDWFISQQFLDADFGTPYHGSLDQAPYACCLIKEEALKRRAGDLASRSIKRMKLAH